MNALLILALTCIIATGIVTTLPKWDSHMAWIVGVVLALVAGVREGGFDYDEYLTLIQNIRSLTEADFSLRLFAAKDPIFLLLVESISTVTQETRPIFLTIAIFSVMFKVLASAAVPGRRTLFMALYTLFLAPGLEFAAMRAGLAIGVLLFAYALVLRWRPLWLVLAITSHSSALIAVAGRLMAHRPKTFALVALFTMPLGIPILVELTSSDPRYMMYLENPGTVNALIVPLLTLCGVTALVNTRQFSRTLHGLLTPGLLATTLFCTGLAVLLALPFVTVAFRVLEIGWALMLIQLVALASVPIGWRGHPSHVVAWSCWLAVLSVSNLTRNTWRAMFAL